MRKIRDLFVYSIILTGLVMIITGGCNKDHNTNDSSPNIPVLTTNSITYITDTSAITGGNITDDHGLFVTLRGVCWSTEPNPDINSSKTTDGIGEGGFVSNMTKLNSKTVYYVKAYATNIVGTGYGQMVTFKTN